MKTKRRVGLQRAYVSEGAVERVIGTLRSGWIGQGERGQEFEEAFRKSVSVPYAVAVNTCAAALRLALAISNVTPGTEVITTPLTWQATNHPILEQFAHPVFADIQYLTANLNPADIEHRITEKTRAILCVHWGGYPCDMAEIHSIAKKYDINVIEEAAEALGGTYHGQPVGTLSRFTAFSFYAIHTVTTVEGGMLTMLNEDDYETARRCRWFGIDRAARKPSVNGYYEYDVTEPGYNYPMTDVTASLGVAHLRDLPALMNRRKEIAEQYRRSLERVPGLSLFENRSDRSSGYGLFTIHVEKRDDFCRMMRSKGVDVSVVHVRNDQYTIFGGLREDLPILDQLSKTYICIPMHNLLSDDDVRYVIDCISEGW